MQIRILLFVISIICFNETYAQFYPYNPYNNPYANPGYIAGQQIGNAIAQKNKYGRNQLRKSINKWGECNNGSLSLSNMVPLQRMVVTGISVVPLLMTEFLPN